MRAVPHAPLCHYDDNAGTLVTSGLVWVTGAVTHLW